jgi:hypothetical protein
MQSSLLSFFKSKPSSNDNVEFETRSPPPPPSSTSVGLLPPRRNPLEGSHPKATPKRFLGLSRKTTATSSPFCGGEFTTASAALRATTLNPISNPSSSQTHSNNGFGAPLPSSSPSLKPESTPQWHSVSKKRVQASPISSPSTSSREDDEGEILTSSPYFSNGPPPPTKRIRTSIYSSPPNNSPSTSTSTSTQPRSPSTPSPHPSVSREARTSITGGGGMNPVSTAFQIKPKMQSKAEPSFSTLQQQKPQLEFEDDDLLDLLDDEELNPPPSTSSFSPFSSTATRTPLPPVNTFPLEPTTRQPATPSASPAKRVVPWLSSSSSSTQPANSSLRTISTSSSTSSSSLSLSSFKRTGVAATANEGGGGLISAFNRRKDQATNVSDDVKSNRFEFTPTPKAKAPATSALESHELEMLSEEQRTVLELAKEGRSFFFTGAAGTGKSFLLKMVGLFF